MSTIIRYAIRRISDGFYMPQPFGRNGRGGSSGEPADPNHAATQIRLFHNKQAAIRSLSAWLKGEWVTRRGNHHDNWSSAEEYYEETEIVHKPDRNKDDMEVVAVKVDLP